MSENTQNPSSITTTITTTSKNKPTTKKGGGGGGGGKSKPMKRTASAKQQPMKVVYISNPMRIEASAAEFRALVQELTGRDAADWAGQPNIIPRPTSPDNISNDLHVPASGDDKLPGLPVTVSCFGSDLGCFGPFDGDDESDQDQMVIMEDQFSSFCDWLQQ